MTFKIGDIVVEKEDLDRVYLILEISLDRECKVFVLSHPYKNFIGKTIVYVIYINFILLKDVKLK